MTKLNISLRSLADDVTLRGMSELISQSQQKKGKKKKAYRVTSIHLSLQSQMGSPSLDLTVEA